MKQENTKLQEIMDIATDQSVIKNKGSNSSINSIKPGREDIFYRIWIIFTLVPCIGMAMFLNAFILEGNTAQNFTIFTVLYMLVGIFAYSTLNKYLMRASFIMLIYGILSLFTGGFRI